ncbi:glycerate kinase type-2 family protein [Fimbriimonas ginsengisoli]|uniref:Glycerate kinase n=1 Tax=Fimbriimonas ginsengisoli Gsoil 348 TaxID=661478 RepID=A0A068NUP3_FIMGI|nr:DUF4147 domain-containing protein [Fimbriimonas ginsengisoli]AIE87042.1 Glycerate kinase [Fimbriimonas ginsengisoli Gsoil 348]
MTVRATPRSSAGQLAVEIYGDVLEQVRADRLVRASLQYEAGLLMIQGHPYDLSEFRRVQIVAVGKAAAPMAREAADLLGSRLDGGLVVTKPGYGEPVSGLELLEAGHPVPDEGSLVSGRRILELAEQCGPDDFVLFLLSGGASALMEAPNGSVTLEDLRATNERLLASGADIAQLNAIRSRVSRIKAGGLAHAFRKAKVVALVLSDVIGNHLATIGSGPLVSPNRMGPFPYALLDQMPETVRAEVLTRDLVTFEVPRVDHYVIGSLSVAVHAAADAARARGLDPLPYGDPMQGEAREMARRIVALAKRHVEARPGDRFCLIFGGETTVTVRGSGIGGRCQEMVVAAAPAVAKLADTAFLAAGTDGADGPTEAAGGLVETDSLRLAKEVGNDQRKALVNNDSFRYLLQCDGLLFTGPTGSNVNDLCLVVHAPTDRT